MKDLKPPPNYRILPQDECKGEKPLGLACHENANQDSEWWFNACSDTPWQTEYFTYAVPDFSRVERLKELLDDLQRKERNYRISHDTNGDGHAQTGYCWDQMRKAGDIARAALEKED